MKRLALGLIVLTLCGAASAQSWSDAFNYPSGTTVGNWVEFLKDWQATGTEAQAEDIRNYQFMTNTVDAPTQRDCCVDVIVTYNTNAATRLQFGGVAVRVNDPGMGTFGSDLILIKFQDNNSSGDFDSAWLYEHSVTGGLSAASSTITPSKQGRVRLLAIDNRLVARIDRDMDGKWDVTITKTVVLPIKMGPVGLCGYGGALMDNFRLFNAVLLDATNSPKPNPGNTIQMVMRGAANAPYIAAISFGTGPIPLSPVAGIPLAPDNAFFASLAGVFPGFQGTLDGNGDGTLNFAIPNIPQLVGLTFYTGFVNAQPGITHVSNDHEVTIT